MHSSSDVPTVTTTTTTGQQNPPLTVFPLQPELAALTGRGPSASASSHQKQHDNAAAADSANLHTLRDVVVGVSFTLAALLLIGVVGYFVSDSKAQKALKRARARK